MLKGSIRVDQITGAAPLQDQSRPFLFEVSPNVF